VLGRHYVSSLLGGGGEVWRWRWRLWAWEEDLVGECRTLLHTIVLQHNVPYQWHWYPDIIGGYTVRTSYHLLTSQDLPIVGISDALI